MAVPSQKLVTRLPGKIDGLIAARVPLRNGTQITNTRRPGSVARLKMLLCTQLAPARHAGQVGEKMRISRVCTSSRLNSDFSVSILFSVTTLALLPAAPLLAVPEDAHEDRKPGSTASTAVAASARISRKDMPVRLATRIPSLFPDWSSAWHRVICSANGFPSPAVRNHSGHGAATVTPRRSLSGYCSPSGRAVHARAGTRAAGRRRRYPRTRACSCPPRAAAAESVSGHSTTGVRGHDPVLVRSDPAVGPADEQAAPGDVGIVVGPAVVEAPVEEHDVALVGADLDRALRLLEILRQVLGPVQPAGFVRAGDAHEIAAARLGKV